MVDTAHIYTSLQRVYNSAGNTKVDTLISATKTITEYCYRPNYFSMSLTVEYYN